MSSVNYKEASSNPKTLVGYVNNAKYMQEYVQAGDILFNEKDGQLLMFFKYKDDDLYLLDITNKCFFNEGSTWTNCKHKRNAFIERYKELLKNFSYIPVNKINSVNLDVEMK